MKQKRVYNTYECRRAANCKLVSLRRKGKSPQAKTERRLWELCRKLVRVIYPEPKCYTCGRYGLEGQNDQTGHMWPKGSLGALLKYDVRILGRQCYFCNINMGGNGAVFYRNKIREKGAEWMEKMEQLKIEDKKGKLKAHDHYKNLIVEYERMLQNIDTGYVTTTEFAPVEQELDEIAIL
jgi:hypothetical protein